MDGPNSDQPKQKMTWQAWLALAFIAYMVIALPALLIDKVGQRMGWWEKGPPSPYYADTRPKFDRTDCLNRNSYRIRYNDPLISDEMLSGDVARACMIEEQEFRDQFGY